ncbi:ectoine hydroxylase [Pseudalkalibacillus salsuginis]|uniref:ectoine hydroxylase n=1 Tax=Pseudalkalibacillus salsuginis TaxID=2910972 RepID=UPI001F235BE4|nr:ectoine hydroxylase [Pseudalkalibacillus salsuginis]MCF6410656.1 ectoine hydroxylase [Pseudalkalibacillus salsuginis]
MEDLYPSRNNDQFEVLQRKDPVIHGDVRTRKDCPLSDQQLSYYEENGFIMLENFFNKEEVKKLQNEIFNLRDENQETESPKIIREPESDGIRSIFDFHKSNSCLDELTRTPELINIVNHLLGDDVYIHQSRVNYKPGFTGKEFYWHSDFETWHVEDGMPRMRGLSVSIALSDNYSFNGPLMLVPGSHHYYISCAGETPEDHFKQSLKRQELGVPDHDHMKWLVDGGGIEVPTGKAGSLIIFESNTMHGSNSNITPYDRNNLFLVYNSVHNRLVQPFSGGKPRPDFIANRREEEIKV